MTITIRERGPDIHEREATGALKIRLRDSRDEAPEETIQVTVPNSSRAGKLTFEGDYATLTFERRIRHPVQLVWDAVTEPEHVARWYMTRARIEGREGGSIDYLSGPAQYHVTGQILEWQPPSVFEHEWNVEPRKELPKGEKSIVRWELIPDGDGTILRVTHKRLTRQTALGFVAGVHAFLDRLENELDGTPLTDWATRVAEVRASYQQWGTQR
jgi:uncharacterized protein YndB with AHSA1/START domain